DDLGLAWVHCLQPIERLVERDQILAPIECSNEGVVKRDLDDVTATSLVASSARRVNQHTTHGARRHCEEVRAVLPLDLRDVNQSQVRLVDERRCLECVPAMFASHVAMCESMKLGVDEWN